VGPLQAFRRKNPHRRIVHVLRSLVDLQRHQLAQEFQPLCHQLSMLKKLMPVALPPGRARAGDKTRPDRVFGNSEDDWYRCGCRLGRQCRDRTSGRNDHSDLSANQFRRQR
jgi:hypothetical protein